MAEHLRKQGFLGRTERLFSRKDQDVYSDILFQESEHSGDETWPALDCPNNWSSAAAELLAEGALCRSIPSRLVAVEENTVPSWLWRRTGQGTGRKEEFSAQHIFDRVAASATYKGWKEEIFADENAARTFFDETRSLLIQRLIAFEPTALATLGLQWAYGIKPKAAKYFEPQALKTRKIDISNSTIDALVRGITNKTVEAKRNKLWSTRRDKLSVTLNLSDVTADWGNPQGPGVRIVLDLLGFRHNDGWVNIAALRHAVRLTTILVDLHEDQLGSNIEIGFSNLGPLLLALALPYDSDQSRSMAAAISAIITAEAYATSAELADLRGPSKQFVTQREAILRVLRNHRRAAYGDRNDYEKISVLPAPLMLEHSPDLALIASAQRRWEDVVGLARQHGLRQTQVSALTVSPTLAIFMESLSQGIAPLSDLMVLRQKEGDRFHKEMNSSVVESMARLGYDANDTKTASRFMLGAQTLEKAPVINHTSLRSLGFDNAVISRIEEYLPYVDNLHLAFTPWNVGEEFCRKSLKISLAKLQNPQFDLLRHLGFSAADITGANVFCYGHGSLRGAKEILQQHRSIFACGNEISAEARIRMAAAVQGFISGDVGLNLSLPLNNSIEKNEALLLAVWRQGLKSVSIAHDNQEIEKKAKRRIGVAAFLHTKGPAPLPTRRLRPTAKRELVSLGRRKSSAPTGTKNKRS